MESGPKGSRGGEWRSGGEEEREREGGDGEGERGGETDRQRKRQRERRVGRERDQMRVPNSKSKTLILKDSSFRSISTYLTVSPRYTTNTNKHNNIRNIYIRETDRQRQRD